MAKWINPAIQGMIQTNVKWTQCRSQDDNDLCVINAHKRTENFKTKGGRASVERWGCCHLVSFNCVTLATMDGHLHASSTSRDDFSPRQGFTPYQRHLQYSQGNASSSGFINKRIAQVQGQEITPTRGPFTSEGRGRGRGRRAQTPYEEIASWTDPNSGLTYVKGGK